MHDNYWDGGEKQDEKKARFRILGDYFVSTLVIASIPTSPVLIELHPFSFRTDLISIGFPMLDFR